MFESLKNYFSSSALRPLRLIVEEVNALEPEIKEFSPEGIREASRELALRVREKNETLDDILPRAFALAREASVRTLEKRPFDVQLMGGAVLHKRGIAEMVTGEGKTLAAVLPAYLNALTGRGVHVVTVNEYLARRDAVWMGEVYHALGVSVSCLVPNAAYRYDPEWHIDADAEKALDERRDTMGAFLVQQEFLRPISRREAYQMDITYGTNHEFGFDYLRDNLAYRPEEQVQREHYFVIIDEADSILIDEARTPLIIAAPDQESSEYYKKFARVAANLAKDDDYAVDEKHRTVSITEAGIEKVEKVMGVPNLYAPEHLRLVHYLEESLRAKALFTRDKDYVVKNGEVIIVDEFTGRLLHGRRYNGGLHQAIEAKESVLVKEESRTYAKISIQNYFRMYEKVSGMTGTAQTSAEEFHKVYNIEVTSIPTHKPLVRVDATDLIYKTADARWHAVVKDIRSRYEKGQPVLVGTTSIEKNELLSSYLSRANVPHEVLNAKNNEREGAIIAQAGRLKAVTVATNMAGRGVDIILGGNPPSEEEAQKVKELGGLYVIGTERHEARRIDNQLRGRTGRQGDPGLSQFYLSLEDDLLRIFGGDRIKNLMDRFDIPEDQPIQTSFVSKAVGQAQAKVEGSNFDLRKHLLEYDDVLNKQRTAVYKRRQELLRKMRTEEFAAVVAEATMNHAEKIKVRADSSSDGDEPKVSMGDVFKEAGIVTDAKHFDDFDDTDALRGFITSRSLEAIEDPQSANRVLNILDLLWMNHLENLEALSESVGLRAYGQKDPLVEYRQEAHRLFRDFWDNFNGWIFSNLFKLASAGGGVAVQSKPAVRQASSSDMNRADGATSGRNDPCPCGAKHADGRPMKYKKCHGA